MGIEERIERLEKAVQAIMDLPVMSNLAQHDFGVFNSRFLQYAKEKSAELESLPADKQDEAKKIILRYVYSASPALSLKLDDNS